MKEDSWITSSESSNKDTNHGYGEDNTWEKVTGMLPLSQLISSASNTPSRHPSVQLSGLAAMILAPEDMWLQSYGTTRLAILYAISHSRIAGTILPTRRHSISGWSSGYRHMAMSGTINVAYHYGLDPHLSGGLCMVTVMLRYSARCLYYPDTYWIVCFDVFTLRIRKGIDSLILVSHLSIRRPTTHLEATYNETLSNQFTSKLSSP